MEHLKAGARPTRFGPEEWFTGTVLQDPIVEAPAPARVRAARVTFLPGARTNWHTHVLGQTLIITAGLGRVHADELRPEWLEGRTRVGLTAGASAPEVLVNQVVDRIKSLGAVAVQKMDGVQETMKFPLPKGLKL